MTLPGATWHRTGFRLDLPEGQDVSAGPRFGGGIPAAARVVVYLNALAVTAAERVSGGPGPIGLFAYGNVRGGVPVSDVPAPSYPLAR
ncbi:hypothetical protein [Microbispora sp. KK1-11]|uniref:hypothetical protein n=1 Tax=Microbispora sp. KK1-11 TaxID=2053005 RepID=UPI001157C429|nr:hypothetical protein [Microbispora sp. KK1-11]TQS30406.1 hypothetical protein FLW16_03825 [Microbispora sp. KK1-11]